MGVLLKHLPTRSAEGSIVCVRVEGPFKDAPLNLDEMIPVIHYHVVPLASSLDAPTDRSTSSSGEDRWEQIK